MASLDAVSIGILLGALLVLAGILSSLVALRFGAPLLLVFLIIGMLAGGGGIRGGPLDRGDHVLHGGVGRAGADPVRWGPAHPLRHLPQRARALAGARHRRR